MTPWEKLCDELRDANQTFADDERAGAGKSLDAILTYLDEMGMPADLRAPLFALFAALTDLQNGKQPEMLKKVDLPHAPPVAIALQLERAQVAAAMQLLKDAGDTKEGAARAVIRRLEGGGVSGVTWQQVSHWRDDFRTRPKGDLAASAFHALTQDYKTAGRDPRVDAEALLTGCVWTKAKNLKNPPT